MSNDESMKDLMGRHISALPYGIGLPVPPAQCANF